MHFYASFTYFIFFDSSWTESYAFMKDLIFSAAMITYQRWSSPGWLSREAYASKWVHLKTFSLLTSFPGCLTVSHSKYYCLTLEKEIGKKNIEGQVHGGSWALHALKGPANTHPLNREKRLLLLFCFMPLEEGRMIEMHDKNESSSFIATFCHIRRETLNFYFNQFLSNLNL